MRVGEIILYVGDMESQVRFYRDTLELPVDGPIQDDYSAAHWVTFKTGVCKLALHSGGRPGPTSTHAVKLVFMVQELDEARARLMHKGVALSAVRSPAPGVSVCDGIDPEGNPFSLESGPDR